MRQARELVASLVMALSTQFVPGQEPRIVSIPLSGVVVSGTAKIDHRGRVVVRQKVNLPASPEGDAPLKEQLSFYVPSELVFTNLQGKPVLEARVQESLRKEVPVLLVTGKPPLELLAGHDSGRLVVSFKYAEAIHLPSPEFVAMMKKQGFTPLAIQRLFGYLAVRKRVAHAARYGSTFLVHRPEEHARPGAGRRRQAGGYDRNRCVSHEVAPLIQV